MLKYILVFALFTTAALADDLDDAYSICRDKRTIKAKAIGDGSEDAWGSDWKHCYRISAEKEARDRRNEAQDADLKKTKDVLRKLQGK